MAKADFGRAPAQVDEVDRRRSGADFVMNAGERLVLELELADRAGALAYAAGPTAPRGAVIGGVAGGVVVGALGLLVALGLLPSPSGIPLLAAGPILAALSGVGVGVILGGLLGGLVGSRIPAMDASLREAQGRGGNILISVRAEEATAPERARVPLQPARLENRLPPTARLSAHH